VRKLKSGTSTANPDPGDEPDCQNPFTFVQKHDEKTRFSFITPVIILNYFQLDYH
jgi:hypothetical protein